MNIKANANAKFWQPDQIAECLPVSDETYKELWQLVPLYDKLPKGEAPGEFIHPVTKYWNRLTDQAKLDINTAMQDELGDL